jgi:hypothetical protein
MRDMLRMFLFCASLLLIGSVAYAQEATETPIVNESIGATFSFGDLGYENITISGGFGVGQLYIPIAPGWEATGDTDVSLSLVSSPLLKSISSLTVSVNNQPLSSIRLNGNTQSFDFTIPKTLIRPPGLLLQFEGYLRVTDDTCEHSNIPSQWARILGDSWISLHGRQNDAPPQLADLSALMFARSVTGDLQPLLFVLPDQPDVAMLTTAARVAAGLAHLSNDSAYPLDVATAASVTPEQLESANVILLGLPTGQPLLGQLGDSLSTLRADGLFYTDDGQPVPDTDAVLQLVHSPWNLERNVLVVSANAPQGMENAGVIFSNQTTLLNLDGSYVFAAHPLSEENRPLAPAWSTETTSLEQLKYDTRTVRGTGILNEYYTIYRPAGSQFAPGAQFVLRGSASPLLRNEQSYVAVFLNEIQLGAYPTANLIDNQMVTFQIPASLDQARHDQRLTLRVEVSNQVLQDECRTVDRENAWTQIDHMSGFVAAYSYLPVPDLQAFPYPFAAGIPTAPVRIVVPDAVEPQQVEGVIRLAFELGFASFADIDLGVLALNDLDPSAYDSNLIFLLNADTQPGMRALFANAEAANGEAASAAEGTESALAGDTTGLLDLSLYRALDEPFGLLYTDQSPANPERTVLIILSDSADGFRAALTGLTQTMPPVSTSGTVAIVQEAQTPYILYKPEDIVALTAPTEEAISTDEPADDDEGQASIGEDSIAATPLMSEGSASLVIIVIPIVVSLLLILAIWVLRRGHWGG